ncbi:MAG: hypothetical protein M3416_07385 [Acidobacteriota bacterium]|nr:hypothetical protein [Acidobacteriota bacterium]
MRKALLAACALLALTFGAAAAQDETKTTSRSSHSATFDDKTEVKRSELRVAETNRRVRLRVKFNLAAGELRLKLRDARGQVRQDIVLSRATQYEVDSDYMRAAAGVWTLELGLKGATGSYDIVWTAE